MGTKINLVMLAFTCTHKVISYLSFFADPVIEIEVVRGFLTNVQNKRKFDIINDKRYGLHNLGVALQLRYKQSDALTDKHTPYK